MSLPDDVENLLAVLLDAIEDGGDSRAMQVEALLKVVRKKLRKAHTCIDRQESRPGNLFLAYFELKAPPAPIVRAVSSQQHASRAAQGQHSALCPLALLRVTSASASERAIGNGHPRFQPQSARLCELTRWLPIRSKSASDTSPGR